MWKMQKFKTPKHTGGGLSTKNNTKINDRLKQQ